jgi:predicted transcriptional regulator
MTAKNAPKQKVTIRMDGELIRKAKALAARRSTSISELLTEQIEKLVDGEQAYDRAQKSALVQLDKGFHLGGTGIVSRAELYWQ